MSKALIAAISALALTQIAMPGVARSDDLSDRRIEQLLNQLATRNGPGSPLVTLVTRSAGIVVNGTIKRVSEIKLPLTCTLSFYDGQGHYEEKSLVVTFSGDVGTCHLGVPFKWEGTDPNGKLSVSVNVSNEPQSQSMLTAVAGSKVLRTSNLGFPEIPLPAEGATKTVTFNIRM